MARKKKSLLDQAMSVNSSGVEDSTTAAAINVLENEKIEKQQILAEDDTIVNIEDEASKLSEENNKLIDSVAGYLEQIDQLKADNNRLQTQYNQSLQQISDLTFELAKLKMLMQNMSESQSINNIKENQTRLSTEVPYQQQVHYTMNGYENNNWN